MFRVTKKNSTILRDPAVKSSFTLGAGGFRAEKIDIIGIIRSWIPGDRTENSGFILPIRFCFCHYPNIADTKQQRGASSSHKSISQMRIHGSKEAEVTKHPGRNRKRRWTVNLILMR